MVALCIVREDSASSANDETRPAVVPQRPVIWPGFWVGLWLGLVGVAAGVLIMLRYRKRFPAVTAYHDWLDSLGVPAQVRNLDHPLVMLALATAIIVLLPRALRVQRPSLWKHPWSSLGFAALSAVPMAIACAVAGSVADASGLVYGIFRGVAVAAFVEELLFRGALVAIPVLLLGVRFWPAAIVSAVLFGLVHITWTSDAFASGWPEVLITGAGGVFYAWIARAWGWSLWPVIWLHAFMNLSWLVFDVASNATGGLVPNIGRGLTIAAAIILTLRFSPAAKDRRSA
ncbi:MAG: CPBP family intramembrane glutamic endopeptidase [Planctomycetota bacterium]